MGDLPVNLCLTFQILLQHPQMREGGGGGVGGEGVEGRGGGGGEGAHRGSTQVSFLGRQCFTELNL